jgi:hypothetical protein
MVSITITKHIVEFQRGIDDSSDICQRLQILSFSFVTFNLFADIVEMDCEVG